MGTTFFSPNVAKTCGVKMLFDDQDGYRASSKGELLGCLSIKAEVDRV